MRFPRLRSLLAFPVILSLAIGAAGPVLADPCPADVVVPVGLSIYPERPCAGDNVSLVVSSCRPCVSLLGIDTTSFTVNARMNIALCHLRLVCRPDTLVLPLGRLAAGSFTV